MINCDEATLISDKMQYNEAGFFERMKLGFHLNMCKHCKLYNHQNKVLTKVILYKEYKELEENLSDNEKRTLKKTLKKSCNEK